MIPPMTRIPIGSGSSEMLFKPRDEPVTAEQEGTAERHQA